MTASSHKSSEQVDGAKYYWQQNNLLAATKSVSGHWHEQNDDQLANLKATRIITDTRRITAGDIFLAIIGDNFDGHDFVEAAAKSGAVAAIVSRPVSMASDIPQLIVDDTRLAFGQLAAYQRHAMSDVKIIAITGSSGKTTCKEMLGSIFDVVNASKESRFSSSNSKEVQSSATLITKGNLNNDLGVPMTLLELTPQHRYAVLELGANHVGEIAYTTQLVQPDVACVLNVGTAHLGEFGGRDAIAATKSEIYQSLTSSAVAVTPLDDDYIDVLCAAAKQHTSQIIGFGWRHQEGDDKSDIVINSQENNNSNQQDITQKVYASAVHVQPTHNEFVLHIAEQSAAIHLPLAGAHNVSNALAAAACAHALGIGIDLIAQGLEQAQATKGRLARQQYAAHCLIDDTYNANPHSVRAAADVLSVQQGHKIMVLGDIAELGDAAPVEHQQLGSYIAAKTIDSLLCVGALATATVKGACQAGMTDAHAFSDKQQLFVHLKEQLDALQQSGMKATVLFKGSRSMTMETLIAQLMAEES